MPITKDQLKAVAPMANVDLWVPLLNKAMDKFSIDQKRNRQIDFLAQALHESDELSRLVEGLNYSPDGLAKTWPTRFSKPDGSPNILALNLGRTLAHAANQQGIANHAYGSRMGNRPPESGDGYKNRGRGIFQTTGAENYQKAGVALGLDLIHHPELLEQPIHAAMSAGYYYQSRGCNEISDAGDPDFKLSTKAINGKLIGLEKRVGYRNKLRKVIL